MTFRPLDNLDGKVAVITGVAGGIGSATALRLAARGARIVGIVRRNLADAQTQLDALPNSHLNHLAVLADVTVKDQVKEAYKVVSDIGRCDILVNTAGETRRIPHSELQLLSDSMFDTMLTNNLRSYYTVIRVFVPLLESTPESVIINIGSMAGQGSGSGSNLAYCAAKAGVDSLTRTLSASLAPKIRVMGVSPGAVQTGFVPNPSDGYYNIVAKNTPLKRVTTAEDVAAVVEACTTLLRFTTGNVIAVDGGKNL